MKRIAVTGARGRLGGELCRQLGSSAVPLDLPEWDLTDQGQVRAWVDEQRPEVLINCAAYTIVDRAESEPEACHAVNAAAVENLAQACRTHGVLLVQLSTDYVFGGDGSRTVPYTELDQPAPLSVYGQSKVESERFAARCPRHIIVRTCGLYGGASGSASFVTTMLRFAARQSVLRVVDDQRCCPSDVRDVARAILFLLGQSQYGTYHIVNTGSVTWHGFAAELFRLARIDVQLDAITSAQYGAAAARPAYSVLDTAKYQGLGGPRLPSWQDALADYLRRTQAPA